MPRTNCSLPRNTSHFLENIEFQEWCEKIGNEYFVESQNCIPVSIQKYIELSEIQSVKYNPTLVSLARLVATNSGFVIELNKKIKTPKQINFFISHEIAHTFFYQKIDNQFIPSTQVHAGSVDLEYACDRIARCLIIPNNPFIAELTNYPSIHDESFSLKVINQLCSKFNVNHNFFMIRITDDLSIWKDFILIRFRSFGNSQKEWRIVENYFDFSSIKRHSIFIPQPDKHKDWSIPKKYPQAKGNLHKFIDTYFHNLIKDQELKINIKSTDIIGQPLESFFKFYKSNSFNSCLISKTNQFGHDYINLLIRLDKKFID